MTDLVARLLERRGITLADDIERFLTPNYERDTHHFSLLEGIERATTRILRALQNKERIAIYADFDCDGVPGAALLHDFFQKIEYTNIEVYIPHRDKEGYGIHREALNALKERGVSLVITVDVGTVAIEPIRYAKESGLDVIVTDHHEPIREPTASNGPGARYVLPDCVAVINPKLGEPAPLRGKASASGYPFKNLCGSAVAWKLVCALLSEGKKHGPENFKRIPDGWEKWLLDLVAIASVADMVPLIGENRALVHFGLAVLRKSPRPGIRALCAELRLRQSELTEDDIGFSFAPRINAASRMGDPETAFKLLISKNKNESEELARHLESLNAKRKGLVAAITREAKKRVATRYKAGDTVVVLGDTAWRPSLLGLVASAIVEERGGLVCLWGENGSGDLKGSCRSDSSVSVVETFARAEGAVIEYGGHHQSGGFSISREQAHTLGEALSKAATSAPVQGEETTHDALVSLSEVSWPLYKNISQLAPFGIGNPKPIFRIARASIASVRAFGKEKNHVEVSLSCFDSGVRARAFDFFRRPEDFTYHPAPGESVDVLGTLVVDSFRGPQTLALRLVDIIPSQ